MTTRPETTKTSDAIILALLGGAVLGAIVTALVTPKTGREVCATLKTAARRLCGRSDDPDDDGSIDALFI